MQTARYFINKIPISFHEKQPEQAINQSLSVEVPDLIEIKSPLELVEINVDNNIIQEEFNESQQNIKILTKELNDLHDLISEYGAVMGLQENKLCQIINNVEDSVSNTDAAVDELDIGFVSKTRNYKLIGKIIIGTLSTVGIIITTMILL